MSINVKTKPAKIEKGAKMNQADLQKIAKAEIPQTAKQLTPEDVAFLVQTLPEKDDTLRYKAFLLLQANSRLYPYTYGHWEELESKLGEANSYQRSLGLMLMAENVRWDKEAKFAKVIDKYLECCTDEKFITSRQAIQGLANVVNVTDAYNEAIRKHLGFLTFAQYKENQQHLLLKDTAAILQLIAKKKGKSSSG